MNAEFTITNEKQAATAFSAQASLFDELYSNDEIIRYKRCRVREHVLSFLKPNSTILELNAGTGEDAVFFARAGHTVHATDISEGMQQQLQEKVKRLRLTNSISQELCSYTNLEHLQNIGPYDLIFSNFAGLNCTADLKSVLHSFNALIKPGGMITLVVLPQFCLWETLLLLKGKYKTAVRRFFNSSGRKANVNGITFKCWYYSPDYIIRELKDHFTVTKLEGLCTLVPPSYMEDFAEKHPRFYRLLMRMESKYKDRYPWSHIGDYYIISLQKK